MVSRATVFHLSNAQWWETRVAASHYPLLPLQRGGGDGVAETNRAQITLGLTGPGKESGVYSKDSRKPSKSFRQGKKTISFPLEDHTSCRVGNRPEVTRCDQSSSRGSQVGGCSQRPGRRQREGIHNQFAGVSEGAVSGRDEAGVVVGHGRWGVAVGLGG